MPRPTILDPVPGVAYSLQDKKNVPVSPVTVGDGAVSFDACRSGWHRDRNSSAASCAARDAADLFAAARRINALRYSVTFRSPFLRSR